MGVSTVIRLPADARARDVAQVMGALLGCETKLVEGKDAFSGSYFAARVKGAGLKCCEAVPECCYIEIKGATVGPSNRMIMFPFEPEEGGRIIMPPATPLNIAMGKALVIFFGGAVDYNDCDSKRADYRCRKPRPRNNPCDNKPWEKFQRDIASVKPLTPKEVKACVKVASYKTLEGCEG